ncbi:MAG: serine-rich protein [Anaerolineae bacterium]|nr:serine-rich protein [Anaerolineae bacterium]
MIAQIKSIFPNWLADKKANLPPDDLLIHTGELVPVNGKPLTDYIWLQVTERENGQEYEGYRVIRLMQIRGIPVEARSDAGLLQKMRTVLRGMSGAQVNLAYLVAGIFENPPLGIVQCYGTVSSAKNLEEANNKSKRDIAVMEAALKAQYRQLRLEPLSERVGGWIYRSLEDFPYALVAVGHPDPRENTRTQRDMVNPLIGADATQSYSLQQNEILYRGMSALREEFMLMVLGYAVPLDRIADMLAGYAQEASIWASQQTGVRSASFGISLPAMLSGAMADTASRGYGETTGSADTDGVAQTEGIANTEGKANTVGRTTTDGWSHTVSEGVTEGTSLTNTEGDAHTEGVAHSTSQSSTEGSSSSTSGASSHTESRSLTGSVNIAPAGVGLTGSYMHGWSDTTMSGWSESEMSSTTHGSGTTNSESDTKSSSVAQGTSQSVSRSESFGTSHSVSNSVANTESESETVSASDTKSNSHTQSQGSSLNTGLARSTSSGLAVGVAPSFSLGNSAQWQNDPAMIITNIMRTQERLLTTASIEGAYYSDVYAVTKTERGLRAMMGLIPEAFQGTEEVVTGVQCRTLNPAEEAYIRHHARAWTPSTRVETVPGVISGYMDSTLLTMLQLAAYTAPGVFEQGIALTTQEETPAFAYYPQIEGDVILGRQWSVETGELTDAPLRLSQERHFHTAIIGDTGFGKTVAAEDLALGTTVAWHYRTIVLDFGQGWRRAMNFHGLAGRVDVRQLFPGARRPLRWNFLQLPKRTDAIQHSTNVATLFANAGRMGERQVGFMRRALVELYGLNGVMLGEIEEVFARKMDPISFQINKIKREMEGLVNAIELIRAKQEESEKENSKVKLTNEDRAELSKKNEDLADRKKKINRLQAELAVLRERQKQVVVVNAIEAASLGVAKGLSVYELLPEQQQALAICRSRLVSVRDWLATLREFQAEAQRKGDQVDRTSLEGVLLRLEQFEKGQMLAQYGPGPDTIAIEDLGLLGPEDDPWGITVVEGGAEMDEFAKAALFSLMAVTIYQDAVIRRRETLTGKKFPALQIFFEEANKVFSGVASGSDDTRASSTAAIWESIFRDARKYKIILIVLAQTASQLPSGILSSCANIFVFQTKDGRDRDILLPHLGRSEKGIVNTEYKRYLARIPKTYAIVKLGYSEDVFDIEPLLIRPVYIDASEPSDDQIVERFLN